MPNGIIVIDKPQDWTASEHALLERPFAKAKGLIQACGSSFSASHPLCWAAPRGKGGLLCLTELL